jgi:hypothetical protein
MPKRYSAWDIATLARTSEGERAQLLREMRFRKVWTGAPFFRRDANLFERPRRRRWIVAGQWIAVLGALGILVLLVWDSGESGASGRSRGPVLPVVVWLVYIGMLWINGTHANPRLIAVRRRRTRGATMVLGRRERGLEVEGDLRVLGEELRQRRECWRRGASRPKPAAMAWVYPPSGTLMIAGFLGMAIGPLMYGGPLVTWGRSLPFLVPVGMVCAVVGSRALARRLLTRLGRSLERGACPDCGYDLSRVPAAFPIETTAGGPVGPRRCVECGCPWPLVPPPVV